MNLTLEGAEARDGGQGSHNVGCPAMQTAGRLALKAYVGFPLSSATLNLRRARRETDFPTN